MNKNKLPSWFQTFMAIGIFLAWNGPAHSDPLFQEVSEPMGLSWKSGDPFWIAHVTWMDFNTDGFPDLQIMPWRLGRGTLYFKNEAGKKFTDVTTTMWSKQNGDDKYGASTGDFNNDGKPDIYFNQGGGAGGSADATWKRTLLVNDLNGTFIDQGAQFGVDPLKGSGGGALWVDFNKDGLLDLAYLTRTLNNNAVNPSQLFAQTPTGFVNVTQQAAFTLNPDVISDYDNVRFGVVSDLFGDNVPDILLFGTPHAGFSRSRTDGKPMQNFLVRVFRNETSVLEDITSRFPSGLIGRDAVVADFNQDTVPDIFMVQEEVSPHWGDILLHQGNKKYIFGRFTSNVDYYTKLPVERGMSFKNSGEVTFDCQTAASSIFIGSQGHSPTSSFFTLSHLDSSTEGLAPRSTPGTYIGYDSFAEKWTVLVAGALGQREFDVSGEEDFSEVKEVNFSLQLPTPPKVTKPLYLAYDPATGAYADRTLQAGFPRKPFAQAVVAGDFDNDMDLDLYIRQTVNGSKPLQSVYYENQGDGTFAEVPDVKGAMVPLISADYKMPYDTNNVSKISTNYNRPYTPNNHQSLAVADFNRDGFLDIFTAAEVRRSYNNLFYVWVPPRLFQNQGNGHHWLEIDLEGTVSNRDAIGAKVLAYTPDGRVQARFQDGGSHMTGQNQHRLHFGLGQNDMVDRLEIRWPSGHLSTVNQISADQILHVTESDVSPPPPHWLQINLEGNPPNMDGIGAKVTVSTPDGQVQTQTQEGIEDLKFELGQHTTADVKVLWPGGITSTQGQVAVDQILQILEPHWLQINFPNMVEGIGVEVTISTPDGQVQTRTQEGSEEMKFELGQNIKADIKVVWPESSILPFTQTQVAVDQIILIPIIIVDYWLQIDLQGNPPNVDGIGAEVTVSSSDGQETQTQEGTDNLMFELSKNTTAEVKVLWPSGMISTQNQVAVDQTLQILEPHWLQIDLKGNPPNVDGIRAKVTVSTPDGQEQTKNQEGSDNLMFELGQHTTAEVKVFWPSEIISTQNQVAVDQTLQILEPHWLQINLKGNLPNVDGIGAKVTISTPDGQEQTKNQEGNNNLMFELGQHTTAEVKVLWPSGIISTKNQVLVDQILQIFEPSSPSNLFQEVSEQVGLSWKSGDPFWIANVTWIDFNVDGFPDLQIMPWRLGRGTLYFKNEAGEKFTDVTTTMWSKQSSGDKTGSSTGDFNNDGRPDVYINQGGGGNNPDTLSNRVLLVNEQPNGVFTNRAITFGLSPAKGNGGGGLWFDFNRDGLLDLAYLTRTSGSGNALNPAQLFTQTPTGFVNATQQAAFILNPDAISDYDNVRFGVISDLFGDNVPDILLFGMPESGFGTTRTDGKPTQNFLVRVFQNKTSVLENITSQFPSGLIGRDAVVADFNQDTIPEIFMVQEEGSPYWGNILLHQENKKYIFGRFSGSVENKHPVEHGMNFKNSGKVSFDCQAAASSIFIGSQGYSPSSSFFTLSHDASTEGLAPRSIAGIYIGYDSVTEKWTLLVSGGPSGSLQNEVDVSGEEDFSEVMEVNFSLQLPTLPKVTHPLYLAYDPATEAYVDRTLQAGFPRKPFAQAVVTGDFDNDMDLDLYIRQAINGSAPLQSVYYENQGDGTFIEVPDAKGATVPLISADAKMPYDTHNISRISTNYNRPSNSNNYRSLAVADYDQNGFLDIFTAAEVRRSYNNLFYVWVLARLFQNQGNGHHWLEIDLEGTVSNRDAIGAKVLAYTPDGRVQVRFQDGGSHMTGQNQHRLHFGLGQNDMVDRLEIRWPSGHLSTVNQVSVDQILHVVEPY